jgi:competence protein ComEC
MTNSRIFFFICLSFIGGIFLNSFLPAGTLVKAGLVILGILLISIFWRYKKITVLGFCILFFVLGVWRHQQVELRIMNNELRKYNDQEKIITLVGVIAKEPDIREKSVKLTVQPENINGRVLVIASRYPEYQYGDKLKIIGKLETPLEFEDFNYKDYLAKDGIYSTMYYSKIELVGQGFGKPIYKILFSFKNKFKETARSFISPPQEGILEALAFGDEGNISKDWKEKFNITGTRHIAAVSGMNITIISALLLNILLLLGFWRNQAFYLSVILLVIYILMIGAPASAVRAGIMGIIFLTAQHFGRLSAASRAVVFSAAIILALNPLLLKLDVGFQLSFLAMMGIIYLQPAFLNFFKKMPDFKFFSLGTTLSTTLSAQIFTLPILIYNFGYIPLISPITNILIVPFLAPITILIFVFGFSAMLFWPLGFLFSLPVWFFLSYITYLIDGFSKLSFVSLSIKNIHWIWLLISYLILGLFIWRFKEKQKLKFLKY